MKCSCSNKGYYSSILRSIICRECFDNIWERANSKKLNNFYIKLR